MPGILWGFGDTTGIGELGLLPQRALSLWGRTNPEEALTSWSVITGQPGCWAESRKWPHPLGKDPSVRIQSWDVWGWERPKGTLGVYSISLRIVWPEQATPPGSRRKPGVSEASGVEDEGKSSIVF